MIWILCIKASQLIKIKIIEQSILTLIFFVVNKLLFNPVNQSCIVAQNHEFQVLGINLSICLITIFIKIAEFMALLEKIRFRIEK